MIQLSPWPHYPGITSSRLSYVAGCLIKARAGCVALHDPPSGDNAWSLGCRAYIRSCFEIREASDHVDWLTVLPDVMPLRITFAIDGWPIRFYRGDVATVPRKYLSATASELLQQKLAFNDAELAPLAVMLRLAVLTSPAGEVLSVRLVEFDTSTKLPSRSFDIPLGEVSIGVAPFSTPRPGVILPPVAVGLINDVSDVLIPKVNGK
jgi:hypothetical protein